MKKKVFTLIELLIVIVIIGIILGALSLLAWKYVLRLRLLSDVKNFENFYYEIYGKTLGYFSSNLSKTGMMLLGSGQDCVTFFIESGANWITGKKLCFNFSKINELQIKGVSFQTGKLIFKSFDIGLDLQTDNGDFYTGGNFLIKINSPAGEKKIDILLDIGKLKIY